MRRLLLAAASLVSTTSALAQDDTSAQNRFRPRVPFEVQQRQQQEAFALMRRGAEQRDSGHLASARATFDSLVRLTHYPNAYAERAKARARLGDTTGALADLDTVLSTKPPLVMALLARGLLRAARGDKRGARADRDAAMRFDFHNPYYPEGFFDRGMLSIAIGDKTSGMVDVNKAAEMGWANAQRVVAGLRPVPMESLNVVYAHEQDSMRLAQRAAADAAESAQSRQSESSAETFVSRRTILIGGALLGGLLVLVTAVFGTRFALTPASQVMQFPMAAGERQLWIGAPAQGLQLPRVLPSGRREVISAVVFLGILWYFARGQIPFFVVALVLGSCLSIARMFTDARRRKITTYALTTKRAIISEGTELTSFPASALRGATLTDNADGTSTIEWGSPKAELEGALGRALAEGKPPSSIDVRAVVRGARARTGAFSHIADGAEALARIRELAPDTPTSPATSTTSASEHAATLRAADTSIGARAAGNESETDIDPAIAAAMSRDSEPNFGLLILVGFLLIGLTVGYFVAFPAVRETLAARNWEGVPCEIVTSQVSSFSQRRSARSSESSLSFSIDVTFRFDYRGKRYYGYRYDIAPMSQGGIGAEERMNAKVAAIPAGTHTTCWVDPAHPENAVIDRGVTGGTLLRVFLPGTFILVSVVGLVIIAKGRAEKRASRQRRAAP